MSGPAGGPATPAALLQAAFEAFQAGQPDRAAGLCDAVLNSWPKHPDALHLRGILHFQAGTAKRALQCVERSLAARPDFPPALFTLGSIHQKTGAAPRAATAFRRVVALEPNHGPAWACLGMALRAAAKPDDAVAAYDRAATLMPRDPNVPYNKGNVLAETAQFRAALDCYRAAVGLAPDHAPAWHALSEMLERLGAYAELIDALRQRLSLEGESAAILRLLALAFAGLERHDEALAVLEPAVERFPDDAALHSLLGHVRLFGLGQVAAGLAALERAHVLEPSAARAGVLLFCQHYRSDLPTAALHDMHLDWQRRVEAPIKPLPRPRGRPDPERRLRLGFVSADLFGHPVGHFLLTLLRRLDRDQFAIAGYNASRRDDATTARIAASCDLWRIVTAPAPVTARAIRDDAIDILIDLGGPLGGDLLEIFAHQPAPVQLSWLGYPNTSGLSRIGWRLTDAIADPLDGADAFATERLVRLPNGFHCYEPDGTAPPVSDLPALRNGHVTFGSLNTLAKISDATVAAWAAVLQRVPDARLAIRRQGLASPLARAGLAARFADRGVAPERLILAATGGGASWLTGYADIDIALDTFPYNGTTTTCDALWMGVPVVTWAGDRHAARVSASLLHRVGLDALVGRSADAFVEIAVDLACDRESLATLRGTLRDRVAASPLCDVSRFAADVGAALRSIWRDGCGVTP